LSTDRSVGRRRPVQRCQCRGMDPVLAALDAVTQALDEVAAVLPGMRAEAERIADETRWECAATRRFRHRLEMWNDGVGALASRIADESEDLRRARAGRVMTLAGGG